MRAWSGQKWRRVRSQADPGRKLAGLRVEQGLKQIDVARRAGIATDTLQTIEWGARTTQLAKIEKVARVLGTSLEALEALSRTPPVVPSDPALTGLNREDLDFARAYHEASSTVRARARQLLRDRDPQEPAATRAGPPRRWSRASPRSRRRQQEAIDRLLLVLDGPTDEDRPAKVLIAVFRERVVYRAPSSPRCRCRAMANRLAFPFAPAPADRALSASRASNISAAHAAKAKHARPDCAAPPSGDRRAGPASSDARERRAGCPPQPVTATARARGPFGVSSGVNVTRAAIASASNAVAPVDVAPVEEVLAAVRRRARTRSLCR